MTGQEAYEAWLSSFYGSVGDAYAKGVKPWMALPEKTQQAWEDVVMLAPKVTAIAEGEGK